MKRDRQLDTETESVLGVRAILQNVSDLILQLIRNIIQFMGH
jgi:hypothetical protein